MNKKLTMASTFFIATMLLLWSTSCEQSIQVLSPDSRVDTTSHNFTWKIDTLGDGNSSILNDVFIIDENNIWAVGSIYLRDSTGRFDPLPYNVAHWNGTRWKLKRISVLFRGFLITPPLEGIYAFSAMDIWFAGSLPIHGNGDQWVLFDVRTFIGFDNISLSKVWGSSSSDMYFCGLGGSLVHYNGSSWQKIFSGTSLPLQDIYGFSNEMTREKEVIAIASDKHLDQGKKMLSIKNNTVALLPDSGLSWSLSGVWFQIGQQYYVVGDGIFTKHAVAGAEQWNVLDGLTNFYTNAIRANGSNDIIVVGAFGAVLHFNGSTWKNYTGNEVPQIDGTYYRVAIKKNIVCAVGEVGNRAAILLGKR